MERGARPPAVVVEVGWVNGLGAIRSLGRSGVRVVAVDHRPWALGFRSRYAERVLAPDPLEDERGFVEALASLGDSLGGGAPIFPTRDEHLNAIARARDELGARFAYPFPRWDVLERIQDKRSQLEAAQRVGLATPRTAHPQSLEDARAAASDIGYPLLVKPAHNEVFKRRHKRQAFYCERDAELARAYEATAEFEPMLQEFVAGGDDALWTLGTYVAEDGTPLARFCGRKLRQTRTHMGTARLGETLWDDEVVESGLSLLRELRFHGIAQVEWKRDTRDGVLKLMEVNPRLWQWHSLSGAAGADVVRTAYLDLAGERPAPVSSNGSGRRWAITVVPREGFAWTRPPYVEAVFALDDPRPGLVHAARVLRRR